MLAGECELDVAEMIIATHAAAVKADQDAIISQRPEPVGPLINLFD
jgi:hypothetical protein